MTITTVKPRQPDRMTIATFDTLNPVFVTDETPCDDLHTTYAWALHVRVPDEYGNDEHEFDLDAFVGSLFAHIPLGSFPWLRANPGDPSTPALVGGDSFTAWCEPLTDPDDNPALHLYFAAPALEIAVNLALAFTVRAGLTRHEVALSTAGDWAEQAALPVFP